MIVIAVDPGITGAFAVYQSENDSINAYDIPIHYQVINKKKRKVLDYPRLAEHFRHLIVYDHEAFLVVERMHAFPWDTPMTAFKLAEIYGAFKGMAFMQDLKVIDVDPLIWKDWMGLKGKTKEDSLELARSYFPDVPMPFKKDHNRAEALLILKYGLEGLQLQCQSGHFFK